MYICNDLCAVCVKICVPWPSGDLDLKTFLDYKQRGMYTVHKGKLSWTIPKNCVTGVYMRDGVLNSSRCTLDSRYFFYENVSFLRYSTVIPNLTFSPKNWPQLGSNLVAALSPT